MNKLLNIMRLLSRFPFVTELVDKKRWGRTPPKENIKKEARNSSWLGHKILSGQVEGFFDFMMAAAVAADKSQGLRRRKGLSDKYEIKGESKYSKKIHSKKKVRHFTYKDGRTFLIHSLWSHWYVNDFNRNIFSRRKQQFKHNVYLITVPDLPQLDEWFKDSSGF